MQRRTAEELCEIVRCGGSLVIYADTRPIEDLIQIAEALNHGASLTLQGMGLRPIQELCDIAQAAPGKITFIG